MRSRARRGAMAAAAFVVAIAIAGGVTVFAGDKASDEVALQPVARDDDGGIEHRVDALLSKMTLEEKLQQIQLLPDFMVTDDEVRKGLGSVLSVTDPRRIRDLQPDRRRGVASEDPDPVRLRHHPRLPDHLPNPARRRRELRSGSGDQRPQYGARESAVVGLKQTYAPMVDVSHEPRWGRISEAAGEDPYLNAVLAAARVKAIQGRDYSASDKLVASPKHFVAYGQPESGRDYNTTDMSEQRLRNLYLPPFKAAVDAGADTVMCSFNAINGVPGCGNDYTMNQILKGEWGFDGFVEGDWTAVAEMRACPPKNPDPGRAGTGSPPTARTPRRSPSTPAWTPR